MADTLTIARRYCGPAESGNGGYSAGALARFVDSPAVEVTLRRPPPLDRPLSVDRHATGATLHDGDALIAEAIPATLDLELPVPASFDVALDASRTSPFRDLTTHPFPTCFGCGPARDEGDGLRIFAGNLAGSPSFAAPWVPRDVTPEVVWAALDCPSCAVIYLDDDHPPPHVLGRMTGRVDRLPEVGGRYVVMSWMLSRDGRKVQSASALFDEEGACCASARATWIALT